MTATAFLLLVPLAAAPADPPAKPEPDLCSRSLITLVGNLRSTDSATQRAAAEELIKAGPRAKAAVPDLVKLLGEKNTTLAHYAIEILSAIGPDAKEAVPALLALVSKDGAGHWGTEAVALALARIDSPKLEATRALLLGTRRCTPNLLVGSQVLHDYPAQVVPHLVTLCADPDANVRARAAAFLGTLKDQPDPKAATKSLYELAGDGAKGVIPALEKLLADENRTVMLAAAQALTHAAPERADKAIAAVVEVAIHTAGKTKGDITAHEVFRPVPERAAKVLVPLFDHDRAAVRRWAITHASYLPVREPIEDALKNGKAPRVREAAALALRERYGSGAASIPALTAALADPEFAVRFAASSALVQIGPRDSAAHASAVPVLVEGLQQKDEAVRLRASQYLRTTGPTARAAVPALTKLLDDPSAEVKLEAGLALVTIDKAHGAAAAPALTQGLALGESLATRAAKALAELGPVAKGAGPELVKHFDAKSPALRLAAAEAAARVDPVHAPKAVETLVTLLQTQKSTSHALRRNTAVALGHIGPSAKPALPALAALLADDGAFHADIALAMIAIDPASKPALEWVRTVVASKPGSDEHEDLYDLMERLPALGARAAPLVPELTGLLSSKEFHTRKRAIEVLREVGPGAKDALPALKTIAASDPRPDVRKLATAAVQTIAGE